MKKITVPAVVNQLDTVLDFINAEISKNNCLPKVQISIAIAVEEIFVNISHYAYHPAEGDVTVCVDTSGDPLCVTIQLVDQGRPYNPLEKSDPNIALSAEERGVGGLGIYMVKKSMDSVDYEYKEERNILTLTKNLA